MNIFEEFRKIVKAIEVNNLKYALVGDVALSFHDQPRFTKDIDLLLSPDDIDNFADVLLKLDFFVSAVPWAFKNADITLHRFIKIVGEDHLQLDVLAANSERSQQIILKALDAESEYGTVRVASVEDLIWMKRKRNSDQDQVDIRMLEKGKSETNR
ncbi:MAG: nucleotidyl transferase AbiEii/AbiGii toxin family protein [Candidatus Aegiribacteria sp.]|nr:nucleotidyl transferase AbiEii/AbiGii toxin family protein [Candidatus Aegiribacteria sp.]